MSTTKYYFGIEPQVAESIEEYQCLSVCVQKDLRENGWEEWLTLTAEVEKRERRVLWIICSRQLFETPLHHDHCSSLRKHDLPFPSFLQVLKLPHLILMTHFFQPVVFYARRSTP